MGWYRTLRRAIVRRITASTAPLHLSALALLPFLGWASEAGAASCLDFSATPFTLKIYNGSLNYVIYPVISTPTNGADEWLQGGFQVPTASRSKKRSASSIRSPASRPARTSASRGRVFAVERFIAVGPRVSRYAFFSNNSLISVMNSFKSSNSR